MADDEDNSSFLEDYYATTQPSELSQDYLAEPTYQSYFSSTKEVDVVYPDFLSNYDCNPNIAQAPQTSNLEASRERRKKILNDLDSQTLSLILSLIQGEIAENPQEKSLIEIRDSIDEQLMQRNNLDEERKGSSFVVDWNGEFQNLIDSPDSIDKFAQLRNLANDFCFTAELYARVIISELYLPTSQKTIKPNNVGGTAGGQKFVVQGILFKFSVDVELKRPKKSTNNHVNTNSPHLNSPTSSPIESDSRSSKSSIRSNINKNKLSESSDSNHNTLSSSNAYISNVDQISPPQPAPQHQTNSSSKELPYDICWMYGGSQPATEFAMKAAKHELRSTIAYFSTDACRVPLVAVVDFRGYRVLCSSILPIDTTTICYGSADAGRTVYSSPAASELFAIAASKLNLKPHLFREKLMHVCSDVEGHYGHDGRMYCIDTARLFPPEAPGLSLVPHSRAMFFRLLRPELVRLYPHPLSSDAFTSFGAHNSDQHNTEVEAATRHLQTNIIPNFAKSLCGFGSGITSYDDLVDQTHKAGINLRYLGMIRTHIPMSNSSGDNEETIKSSKSLDVDSDSSSTNNSDQSRRMSFDLSSTHLHHEFSDSYNQNMSQTITQSASIYDRAASVEDSMRQFILEEMIARCLKSMIRSQWRKKMQEIRICTETPFAKVLLDLLNIVTHKSSSISKHFWHNQIKDEIRSKFCVGLLPHESDPSYDLSSGIDLKSLIQRFVSMIGVKILLSHELITMNKRPFIYTDIISISSVIHHMNIIDYAEGCLLALTSKRRDKTLKLQLLTMAEAKLSRARAAGTSTSTAVVFELANVHYQKCLLLPLHECVGNVIEAIRCYKATLKLVNLGPKSSTIGKCHIRILRLFFDLLGDNIVLQEASLHTLSIIELDIAQHLDGAATARPKALKKLAAKICSFSEPEPWERFLTTYLPPTRKASVFSSFLTCLFYSKQETKDLIFPILQNTALFNFQFCPQVFDTLNSGFYLLTKSGAFQWKSLTVLDATGCITFTSQAIGFILLAAPQLEELILNKCCYINDTLANQLLTSQCVASSKLKTLGLASTSITDRFFSEIEAQPTFCSSIRSLNLFGCTITDSSLKIIADFRNLSTLWIDQCTFINDIRYIKKSPSLTSLSLSGTRIAEPKLKDLFKSILPRLEFLDVSETLVNDAVLNLSERVVSNSTLTQLVHLNLRKTRISKDSIEKLSKLAPNLEYFNLGGNEITHGWGKFVCFPKLTRFEATMSNATSGVDIGLVTLKQLNANLIHLNAKTCWNTITNPVLIMTTRSFPNLRSLNISTCDSLSNAAMESVTALQGLEYLSMSGNRQIVDATLIRIAKALGKSLTGLELSHCKQISVFGFEEVVKHCVELRHLDISFIENMKRIHALGQYCLNLQSIKTVGDGGISPVSFQKLFNRGISLRRVNFKSCVISNQVVTAMAYSCRFLTEVCLADCSLVDDTAIIRLFQLCRYIQRAELTSVSLTDASFSASPINLQNLRFLGLSGCHRVTDKTLAILTVYCPLLEYLNVSGCNQLTESAIVSLMNQIRSLKSLSVAFCSNISEELVLPLLQNRHGILTK